MMPVNEIGCCGAYCGTCRPWTEGQCAGCKMGYAEGKRDIKKARCKIKVCCITKEFETCADCPEYTICPLLLEFYNKNGYKYRKYKEATEYIREYGYDRFLAIAKKWKNAYGKYE